SSDATIADGTSSPSTTPTPTPTPSPTTTPTATPIPTAAPSATSTPGQAPNATGSRLLASLSAPAVFSPNGDGAQYTFTFRARFTSSMSWGLTITDAYGTPYVTTGGVSDTPAVDWDGTSNGARQPDGTYSYHLVAADGFGETLERSGSIRLDTLAPTI